MLIEYLAEEYNPPSQKEVSWVWDLTAFNGEIPALKRMEYPFISIIPRLTLMSFVEVKQKKKGMLKKEKKIFSYWTNEIWFKV